MAARLTAAHLYMYTYIYGNVLWFLWILSQFQCTVEMEQDPLDLLLSSYKNSREVFEEDHAFDHHRHVRDCQPIVYGNTTFETLSPGNGTPENTHNVLKSFFKKIDTKDGQSYVNGHVATISNPLSSLSVLEPIQPGGCENKLRATVVATSRQLNCRLAMNAGFFNTHTGSCLGNLVSNGKFIRDAKGAQNANFGILKNGTLVVGYLSENDVTPGNSVLNFHQLVTGVIWLLRNGSLYVDESIKAECRDLEETGTLQKFAEVVSGRTAVGHDKNGKVMIVQVDGETNYRGINLYDFGKLLQSFGLVNAINLDGGGSATFVANGTIVNYPSDECDHFLCARKVSTVLCVHDKICNPPDCNGHGECNKSGQCVCHVPWTGSSCSQKECVGMACDKHKPCRISIQGNCSISSRNETTKEIIKRFLIKNYAWMDALLAISLLVNLILLFVTFCGRSSDQVIVRRKSAKSRGEDSQNLLGNNYDDDEI